MKKQLGLHVSSQLRAGGTSITNSYKECFDGCFNKVVDGQDTYDGCLSKCLGNNDTATGGTSISSTVGIII